MLYVGEALGILIVLLAAWCVLYPVLSALGIERFQWDRYWFGGAVVVSMVAVLYVRTMIRFWLWMPAGLANEPDGRSRGLKADFLAGVRLGLIAVPVCALLGLGLFFLDRWYMNT